MHSETFEEGPSCKGGADQAWTLLPQPCPSCPWRLDQTAKDIPGFSVAKARDLGGTCPDARGRGPEFDAKVFACHQSRVGEEFACAGWLATVGHCHPKVRLACVQGRVPEASLAPGRDWPALHANYGDVLRKLEESADDRTA